MTWLWLPPCMLLGGLTFRIRGGLLAADKVPGQVARLLWAASCALTAAAAGLWHLGWWTPLPLVPLMWLASTEPLWGAIDLRPPYFWRNVALGCLHGACMGACAAAWLWWLAVPLWWLTLPGGALWGWCYALAWTWPLRCAALGCYATDPPPTGELCFGLAFAAALFVAVAI